MDEMTEVFSIQVFSYKCKDRSIRGGQLYGGILGNDYCGCNVHFKADGGLSDDYLLPDGSLSLTGPIRCDMGFDWFLRLKLYLKKDQDILELCNGYVSLSPFYARLHPNEPRSGVVQGKDGYAVVNFVKITSAVQATVEVSVGAGPVYGTIHAWNDLVHEYNNLYECEYFRSTLFNASPDKSCDPVNGKISLSRCVAAVTLGGTLIIGVNLTLPGDVVVDGLFRFESETSGEDIGTGDGVTVKVTWTAHKTHSSPEACNLLPSPSKECDLRPSSALVSINKGLRELGRNKSLTEMIRPL